MRDYTQRSVSASAKIVQHERRLEGWREKIILHSNAVSRPDAERSDDTAIVVTEAGICAEPALGDEGVGQVEACWGVVGCPGRDVDAGL